jgi:hypothetical protein
MVAPRSLQLAAMGESGGLGAGDGSKEALHAHLASEVWAQMVRPPLPPLRTNRTRRVPHPVLIGHAASLTPY